MSGRGIDFLENWVNENVTVADRKGSQDRATEPTTKQDGRASMLRKILIVVALFSAVVVLPNPSSAESVTRNYSDWKNIAQSARYWYVLGLFDMTLIAVSGDKNTEAVRDGMLKCGPELKYFTAVNAISKYYESNTAHWSDPPYMAFWQTVVRGECLTHVNAARVKLGLNEWPKR